MLRQIHTYGKILKTVKRNIFSEKFEPEALLIRDLVQPGDVCLDIGASYGRFMFIFSKTAGPTGWVYCFEPGKESRAVLTTVKRFHGLRNVTIIPNALSNVSGTNNLAIPIKLNQRSRQGLSLAYLSDTAVENAVMESVTVETLDKFCQRASLKRLDFIKCDVEGAEALVLEGGVEAITRFTPTLLFEINLDFFTDKFPGSLDRIERFYQKIGYRLFTLSPEGRLTPETSFTRNSNYFFIAELRLSTYAAKGLFA